MGPGTILELLETGGLLALLVLALWALVMVIWGVIRKWWVPGWVYEDERRRSREWRRLALRGTDIAEEAVDFSLPEDNGNRA